MCHCDCSFRGLLDSFPLCSHVQLPGALSIGPCAGNQVIPARMESDSLVTCTTPYAQLSRVLTYGGQIWNCGRRVHSWGIQAGSMRSIQAMRCLVHSQILRISPHSFILCMVVSRSPHMEERAESVSRIVCSRSLVGRIHESP